MSNNSDSSPSSKSRFSGSLRIVIAGLLVAALIVVGIIIWKVFIDTSDQDVNRDRQIEVIKEEAKEFNQSRTTETGTLSRVTDEALVIEGEDDERSFNVSDRTEFNRGNAYEPVELDDLETGATVSVTYTVESRTAVGVWQHEE